jgi:para-nitrobenzyl esterase
MKKLAIALPFALLAASPLAAQTSQPAPTAPAQSGYSSASTPVGAMLDDPAARAVLDKHIPGLSSSPQIDMARAMTLKQMQQYAPQITDDMLKAIDADLAALPKKK